MALRPQDRPDIETALAMVLAQTASPDCPTKLREALHHAVFPGGARIRPKLCLAIALANDCDCLELAVRAACAIELLHCASLVHDDLPCFDDADMRRGKPSVHRAYGEPIAVLTGDALIVAALEAVATASLPGKAAQRIPGVFAILSRGVGAPHGICAGQAWESETEVDLARYHLAKTGALFIAATRAGAACAGVDSSPWEDLGNRIGAAYQVADDIQDAIATADSLGKPCHQDEALHRPNAVAELGVHGAARRLRDLIEAGLDSIPACPGREQLVTLVRAQSQSFIPKGLSRAA